MIMQLTPFLGLDIDWEYPAGMSCDCTIGFLTPY